jgi:hypothetical protein
MRSHCIINRFIFGVNEVCTRVVYLFVSSLTLCNTSSFFIRPVQLIFSITTFQHFQSTSGLLSEVSKCRQIRIIKHAEYTGDTELQHKLLWWCICWYKALAEFLQQETVTSFSHSFIHSLNVCISTSHVAAIISTRFSLTSFIG